MNKTIYIRDFASNKVKVEVPDWEDVKSIYVTVLSGDEILDVYYDYHNDNTSITFDSSDDRLHDFYDGGYWLPLELVDKFSEFDGDSYDCMEYIKGLTGRYNND